MNVIHLNGNTYDALTGKLISSAPDTIVEVVPAPVIDTIQAKANSVAPRAAGHHVSAVHHKTVRSHTLKRSAVKKPELDLPAHTVHGVTANKRHAKASTITKHKSVINPAMVTSVNPYRAARAHNIEQSRLVSKFGANPTVITVADVPVRHAPGDTPHAHHAKKHPTVSVKTAHHAQTIHHGKDQFTNALRDAASHEQVAPKRPRLHHHVARKLHVAPRSVVFGAVALTTLAVAGFLAYNHVPSVAMKIAATKSGINGTLPDYQPAGFHLSGPIATAPGEISVSYKSNSDERDFTLVQKSSPWNSQALLENFVDVAQEASYQTFQSSGRTIYVYNGNNATWVDGGIWYKIEGKASLNSDQLLRIAASL